MVSPSVKLGKSKKHHKEEKLVKVEVLTVCCIYCSAVFRDVVLPDMPMIICPSCGVKREVIYR